MQDNQLNSILETLNKDLNTPSPNQPTFVLNGVKASDDGDIPNYQSEPGNSLVQFLPETHTCIGSINGPDNEVYLFSTDDSSGGSLFIFKNDKISTAFSQVDLGFNTNYPITGEFRIRNGCERVLYWCDGFNPDYWFNLDKPDDFKTASVFDANKFKFIPILQIPNLTLGSVNDAGGTLPLGAYSFQFEILDKNLNSIFKSDISPQTPIFDDSLSAGYTQIDGGLNAPQYDPAIGGLPKTNKSITLEFTNLDISNSYIRINVVRNITGLQTSDAHSVAELIPITATEQTFTYKGYFPELGDYPIDYSELLIDNVKYHSSYVMEQVQNRMIRANLKEKVKDYSIYQPYASAIRSKWISKRSNPTDINSLGNSKNPHSYWECLNFQGDEIRAFSIQYLHDDGTESPAFHIPGIVSDVTAQTILTVVSDGTSPSGTQINESDVDFIPQADFETWAGTYIGSTIRRWKVRNTATITSSPNTDDNWQIGEFGYFESTSTYPNIVDCDNNLIWGTDYGGNDITTSTKIRYHRFPDRGLVVHDDGEHIYNLGIRLEDIVLPPNTVGYRILVNDINEVEKTVVDSGIINRSTEYNTGTVIDLEFRNATDRSAFDDQNVVQGTGGTFDGKVCKYFSNNSIYDNKLFTPTHISLQRAFQYRKDTSVTNYSQAFEGVGGLDPITLFIGNLYSIVTGISTLTTIRNWKVSAQKLAYGAIETDEFLSNGYKVNSQCASVDTNFIELAGKVLTPLSVYFTLDSLRVRNYYSYKKVYNGNVYSNIFGIKYKYLNFNYETNTNINLFNGDNFITKLTIPHYDPDNILSASKTAIFLDNVYTESYLNSELRHGGSDPKNKYYKTHGIDASHPSAMEWFKAKTIQMLDSGVYVYLPSILKEFYYINKDFNLFTRQKVKLQLTSTYDYCRDCLGYYPNRIVFSPKSFDEEIIDNYRFNKVNDYIDIPGHRGQITGLKYKNNQLLVHTEDTTFVLQPNPQTISTDQNTAYLSTGDFLSIPPQEILQTDLGYAGCQSKQHQCDTPFGWCWTDQNRGQIFKFDRQLEELSLAGMSYWFKENLPSEIKKSVYDFYEVDYPNNSTYNKNGYGMIMYYDPKFKRLLISKTDSLPLCLSTTPVSGCTTYDQINNIWTLNNPPSEIILEGNNILFENKSWTISYGFDYKGWLSWHSYRPRSAFSDNNHFYTFGRGLGEIARNNGINKHLHKGNYQKFYNIKSNFIIEWRVFTPVTSTLENLYYYGQTLQWDDLNRQWINIDNITFDKMMIYSANQSTGLQILTLQNQNTNPYQNSTLLSNTKSVIKTDENYKISGLYDMAIGKPNVSSKWDDIKTFGSYIDLVSHPTNINFAKSQYDWGKLKDKYFFCRMFFKPTEDYRKIIYLQTLNNKTSDR
jgi:hypothetical protein